MKSVNIAELKNRLSVYVKIAQRGEEVIIRDRNLPVARLAPLPAGEFPDEELALIARGSMRPAQKPLDLNELLKIPTGKVSQSAAVEALLKDREESL